MMSEQLWQLSDEAATARFAAALAAALPDEFFYVALSGDLGAGKTHTVRCLLRALGERGPVCSPTYTLMEDYQTATRRLVHMDLYRLGSAQELEFLGVRELLGEKLCLCVEWAERAEAALPQPDLQIRLEIAGETARRVQVESFSTRGEACLAGLLKQVAV
jgi:tRNA threonylcarbamoyladenosine biosynthesis protein TsaE